MSYSKQSQSRYQRTGKRTFSLNLPKSTNQDVIAKLDSVPNKTAYICGLIRKDLENEKK